MKDNEYILPKLEPDDYKNKGYEFWKNYRETLYKIIKQQESEEKLEKNPENIYKMAISSGVKPTARYFNIEPSQVRYFRDKYKKKNLD